MNEEPDPMLKVFIDFEEIPKSKLMKLEMKLVLPGDRSSHAVSVATGEDWFEEADLDHAIRVLQFMLEKSNERMHI